MICPTCFNVRVAATRGVSYHRETHTSRAQAVVEERFGPLTNKEYTSTNQQVDVSGRKGTQVEVQPCAPHTPFPVKSSPTGLSQM